MPPAECVHAYVHKCGSESRHHLVVGAGVYTCLEEAAHWPVQSFFFRSSVLFLKAKPITQDFYMQ